MFTFPLEQVGRRDLLRAQPPADREHGRIPDHHPGGLDVAGRAARVGAPARVRRARRGDPPGAPRRHHGALLPAAAPISIGHAGARAALLLPHADAGARSRRRAGATRQSRRRRSDAAARRRLTTTALVYAQILLGATMRHTGAGLAIPTSRSRSATWCRRSGRRRSRFTSPTASARSSCSPRSSRPRRTSGGTTASGASWSGRRLLLVLLVLRRPRSARSSCCPASSRSSTRAHVVNGALVLGTSLVLTLRAFRPVIEARTVPGAAIRVRPSGLRSRPEFGVDGSARTARPGREDRRRRGCASRTRAAAPATSSRSPSRGSTCSSSHRRSPAT